MRAGARTAWVALFAAACVPAPPERAPDAALLDAALPDAAPPDAAPPERDANSDPDALLAALEAPEYAETGATVRLDASGAEGAVGFLFDLGDGRRDEVLRADAFIDAQWSTPGRYRAQVTAIAADGRRAYASRLVSVTAPVTAPPASHGAIIWRASAREGYAVVPDADAVTRFTRDVAGEWRTEPRLSVCDRPAYLAAWGDDIAVVCTADDTVRTLGGLRVNLPWGARPTSAVEAAGALWVVLSGRGALARVTADGAVELAPLSADPSVANAADLFAIDRVGDTGDLLVTQRRAVQGAAQLWRFSTTDRAWTPVPLARDAQRSSDTEIGGTPNLLDAVRVAPTRLEVAVPSLQANLDDGLARSGTPQRHDTTVRAVVSFLGQGPSPAWVERFGDRKQFDNRGAAHAAVYSPRGDYLFVLMRGAQSVERMDRLTASLSGTIPSVGYGALGLALDDTGRTLFVNAALSRVVQVYDVTDLRALPRPIATLPLLTTDPVEPQVLRGHQLFEDAADPRLTADNYIACAHCHPDGAGDGQTWDFTQRGEGLRNTTSLLGRAGMGHGPLHWSANFDEVQDFEHDLRGPFAGVGLMEDATFHAEGRDAPLGGPKAGLSTDLDALAAFLTSLDQAPRSPWRMPDGALSPAAARGRALMHGPLASTCGACHGGPNWTVSGQARAEDGGPALFDVGTLTPDSGGRLGGPLTGLDPPTLLDLWATAPYLHDGRAASLREVLLDRNEAAQHGDLSALSNADLDDLVAFLLSLDGSPDELP